MVRKSQEKSGIDLSWSVKGQEMTFCLHINFYQHTLIFFYKKLCDSDRAKNLQRKFKIKKLFLKKISSSEPLVSYKKVSYKKNECIPENTRIEPIWGVSD